MLISSMPTIRTPPACAGFSAGQSASWIARSSRSDGPVPQSSSAATAARSIPFDARAGRWLCGLVVVIGACPTGGMRDQK
jgi:hypothetical protein